MKDKRKDIIMGEGKDKLMNKWKYESMSNYKDEYWKDESMNNYKDEYWRDESWRTAKMNEWKNK